MSSFSQTVTAKQSGNYDRLRPRVSLCCNCGLVTVWLCVIYAFIFSNCDCLRSDIVTHYYRPTQCWHYGNTRTSERSALLETNCYDDALSMRSFSQTVTALRSDIVTHCYRQLESELRDCDVRPTEILSKSNCDCSQVGHCDTLLPTHPMFALRKHSIVTVTATTTHGSQARHCDTLLPRDSWSRNFATESESELRDCDARPTDRNFVRVQL